MGKSPAQPASPPTTPCAYAGDISTAPPRMNDQPKSIAPDPVATLAPGNARGLIRLGKTAGPDACAVFREASLFNGLANAGHQRLVIAQVVQRVEARTEDFIRFLEVKQVGAR